MFSNKYSSEIFSPTNPFVDKCHEMYVQIDTSGKIRCENDVLIENRTLVECRWKVPEGEPNSKKGYWVPMKTRDNLKPNDFNTAINVWKSIHNPITKDMITGKVPLNSLEETIYYKNIGGRDKSIKPLTDFHSYVKDKLIMTHTTAGSILLDISIFGHNF